jgi:alanyl-tRNA synthetase
MAKIVEDVRRGSQQLTQPLPHASCRLTTPRRPARARLFGEKYGDEVRVVSMGRMDGNQQFSVELCGGTHVKNTAEIGAFRIVSEGGVSSGVRRIQAVVGAEAEKLAESERRTIEQLAQMMKAAPAEVVERVQKLLTENQALNTELGAMRKKLAMGGGGDKSSDAEQVGNVKFIGKIFDDLPAKDLKPLADQFKQQLGSGVVVLMTKADGRASLVVGVTEDIIGKVSAVDLVRVGAEALGGKGGGGRPDMAQAGGPNTDDVIAALDDIKQTLFRVA